MPASRYTSQIIITMLRQTYKFLFLTVIIFAKETKVPLSPSPFFLSIDTCVFVAADAALAPLGIRTCHTVDLLVAAVTPFVFPVSAAGSLGRVLTDFFQ